MRKQIGWLFFIALFAYSCKNSTIPSDVQRISLQPTRILSDSIESILPGKIYMSDNFFLWTDPFNTDKYVHVLDKNTGKELGMMVGVGGGPDEFASPSIAILPDDRLFVYDSYAGKIGIQSISSVVNGEEPILMKQPRELGDVTYTFFTQNDELVMFNPSKTKPFTIEKEGKSTSLGKLPFKGEISSGINHFQGRVIYHPYKDMFVYSTIKFPYYAVYERNGDSFILRKELLNISNYKLKDGNFVYNGPVRGPQDLTLTADYIVAIDRDPKYDQTDGLKIGRDFNKLPRQIFLYDYDLNLKKIIDLDRPLAWITADPSENKIYVLTVESDYMILEYEL